MHLWSTAVNKFKTHIRICLSTRLRWHGCDKVAIVSHEAQGLSRMLHAISDQMNNSVQNELNG
jgi:hypothetical protein